MRKIILLTLSICQISLYLSSFAQEIPEHMYWENEHLLKRGKIDTAGFYNVNDIDTIYLDFSQPDFWKQMEHNYNVKIDLPAQLTYRGTVYDSVGVRFKGQTSYTRIGDSYKKSFNITLDYINEEQNIDGYHTINLNNGAEDPTFLREFLFYYLCKPHLQTAKTNFKVLYINDINWGLYVNVQQMDKTYSQEWFINDETSRWRAEGDSCRSQTPAGAFGTGYSTLNYLGDDTSRYKHYYTLKKSYMAFPWEKLKVACDVLNNTSLVNLTDSLGEVFDIDAALWLLAHEILFTDEDGYVNKGGMDYFVYYDKGTGRILPMEYDGNSTIQINKATSWHPFYKIYNAEFPLMNVLLNEHALKQRYIAHLRTLVHDVITAEFADSLIDKYANKIQPYVWDDTTKLFSFGDFLLDIDTLHLFMEKRRNYLLNDLMLKIEPLEITDVMQTIDGESLDQPDFTQEVNISARIGGAEEIKEVNLYYGNGLQGKFIKTSMQDDGLHNDNSYGDRIYGATIPAFPKGTYVRYYIEAILDNLHSTCSYSPVGAEHDIYCYRVKLLDEISTSVVLNELMPYNKSMIMDVNGDYDDWFELFNTTDTAVDISNWTVTDDANLPEKWEFPEGTILEGGDYLIVWADKDTMDVGYHTNFNLSADGEILQLYNEHQIMQDEASFQEQDIGLAWAKVPNGTGNFKWQLSTFGANNETGYSEIQNRINSIKVFPVPAKGILNVHAKEEKQLKIKIINLEGKLMYNSTTLSTQQQIDVGYYPTGVYILTVNDFRRKILIIH